MKNNSFITSISYILVLIASSLQMKAQLYGPNLIVNGDYSQGNVGFTTTYAYCNTFNCLAVAPSYSIGTSSTYYQSSFVDSGDHTTGTGNFMIVECDGTPTYLWNKTVTVQPGTDYEFSFYLSNLYSNTNSVTPVRVDINGVTIATYNCPAPYVYYTWEHHSFLWNSGTLTSAIISFHDMSGVNYANNFGVDDISFRELISYSANLNALDFDGTDDYVTSPQGSSLIAGSSGISLSMWVYPTNPSPGFPDFDGFAGIRNNLDADFYILQYTASDVEARFTNSAGTVFNIVGTGMQLNTWQHYALTYDGVMLRLYRNALPVDSVAATGTILNTTEMFYVGGMLYAGTNYYLDGKMDEVSLWNHSLLQAEINCIYNNGADTSDAALQLYYRFNQGIAGGNNAGLNTLADETSTSNGSLFNFALNGTTSNWVGGINNIISYSDTICSGVNYVFNGQTLSASGTYYTHYPLTSGCDSVVQLTLTVLPTIDTLVLQNLNSLAAHATGVTYQWINCATGNAIAGATSQLFTPTITGSYAVVITQGNCSDTSGCHFVIVTGINEYHPYSFFEAFPNPFSNELSVHFMKAEKNISITITDINGREIKKILYQNPNAIMFKAADLGKGMYFLKVISDTKTATVPLVKY